MRDDSLSDQQREKVIAFWEKSIFWATSQTTLAVGLMSALSRLAPYLSTLDVRAEELLIAVAPHVHVDFSTYRLVKDLTRLVDSNPHGVARILDRMADANVPIHDMDNELNKLIERLASLGLRVEAFQLAEKMRSIPGMFELYKSLAEAGSAEV